MLAIVIGYASTSKPTGVAMPIPIPHADKLIHFIGYGALAFFVCRALKKPLTTTAPTWVLVTGAILAVCYGGALEGAQAAIPERSASMWDMVANAAGAVTAAFLYGFLVPKVPAVA